MAYGLGIGQSSTDGMFNPYTANYTGASGPADPSVVQSVMSKLGSMGLGIGSNGVAPLASLPPQNTPPTPTQGGQYDAMGNPGGGYQAPSGDTSSFSQNPYLAGMGSEMQRQTQLGLQDAFNQIRSNAVGVGGLGGDRQGVAQGVATGQAMGSLQGALSGLYGGAWNADQNRNLQRYGMDENFYNQGRALDQSQTQLGANLFNLGFQGQWNPINNANNVYSQYTGFGSNTNTNQQGGGAVGALGGALGTGQLINNMGGWGGGTNTTNPTYVPTYSGGYNW